MRPASRNPESAQTLPHVKPPKTNTHQKEKKKKSAIEAMLKIPRVIKIDTQTTKKVKNYGYVMCRFLWQKVYLKLAL